jgi:hypothetical protein
VGVSCRLCERTDCEQRAFPPLREPLIIDENLRGVSIYAPAGRVLADKSKARKHESS